MTWWFRIVIGFAIIGIASIIIIFRIRERRRKEEMKRRIAVSQLKALQSQMNPHFIFNTFNVRA